MHIRHMRRFLGLALTIVILCPPAFASAITGTATGNGVKIRESASTNAAILATVTKGTALTVLDETPVPGSGLNWIKVQMNNTSGYISSDYISIESDTTNLPTVMSLANTAAAMTAVTTANVKMRESCSASGNVITTLNANSELTLLDDTLYFDGALSWYYVQYKSYSGYVCADYLRLDGVQAVSNLTVAEPVVQTNSAPPAQLTAGTVTVTSLRLRASPSITAKTLVSASKNETVTILDPNTVSADNIEWFKVTYKGETGYMSSEYIQQGAATADIDIGTGSTTAVVNLRSMPNTSCSVVKKLPEKTQVEITGIEDGWYKVKYKGNEGYLHPNYVKILNKDALAAATASQTVKTTSSSSSTNTYGSSKTTTAQDLAAGTAALALMNPSDWERKLVETGLSYLGCKYVYGASNGKTFDCSGFTSWVYKECGKPINRTSVSQYSQGTKVDKADLRPGDLVFFRDTSINKNVVTHVGIYIGNSLFVHAGSGNSGAGRCVKVSSLNDSYYKKVYKGAKRI